MMTRIPYESFGSLAVGTHFWFRKAEWVKCPPITEERVHYNAYQEAERGATTTSVTWVDEAALVQVEPNQELASWAQQK